MGHRIRTWLKRAVMAVALAAAVVWTGDWLLLRLKIARDRDAFGALGREPAERELAVCEQELERYATRVYEEEAESR